MINLVQDNTTVVMIVMAIVLVFSLGLLLKGILSYIKLISQVTVYHSLSITDRVLFDALREKGVVPSADQLKITEFILIFKAVVFFVMVVSNILAYSFVRGF